MAPIVDLQQRFRELGRLRMGAKVGGKGRPEKLETWRLTSAARDLLEAAAERYGGEVQEWPDAPQEGMMYQLFTTSESLDILVPPGETLEQWYEQWSRGGCKRRCDGRRQVLRDVACACPPDPVERAELAQSGKACKPVTRLSVMLRGIPDLGVWRMESHGFYAATELSASYNLAKRGMQEGQVIAARLRIDKRMQVKDDKTRHYYVPVIELPGATMELEGGERLALAVAPTERRSLPGSPPELGAAQEATGEPGHDVPPPAIVDGEVMEPPDLPQWVRDLPGTDGEIIDAANALIAEAGKAKEVGEVDSVADPRITNAPDWFQERLKERLAETVEEPPPDVDPDVGDTLAEQGGLTL